MKHRRFSYIFISGKEIKHTPENCNYFKTIILRFLKHNVQDDTLIYNMLQLNPAYISIKHKFLFLNLTFQIA